jgi:hypothetical protein
MKIAGCQESTPEGEPGSYFAPQFIIVASLYIDQLNNGFRRVIKHHYHVCVEKGGRGRLGSGRG